MNEHDCLRTTYMQYTTCSRSGSSRTACFCRHATTATPHHRRHTALQDPMRSYSSPECNQRTLFGCSTRTGTVGRTERVTARTSLCRRVAALCKLYGHYRVWAIIFLLITPGFCKPFEPLSLLFGAQVPLQNYLQSRSSLPSPQHRDQLTEHSEQSQIKIVSSSRQGETASSNIPGRWRGSRLQFSSFVNSNNVKNEQVKLVDTRSFVNNNNISHQETQEVEQKRTVFGKIHSNFNKVSNRFRSTYFNDINEENTIPKRSLNSRFLKNSVDSARKSSNELSVSLSANRYESVKLSPQEHQFEPLFPTRSAPSSGSSVIPVIVSAAVSRVPRHTAQPTRLEDPERVRSPRMDSTDSSRGSAVSSGGTGGGGGGGGNSRTSDHWSQPCRVDAASNPDSSPSFLSRHIFSTVNVAHKHAHRFKEAFANETYQGSWSFAQNLVSSNGFEFLNSLAVPSEEQLKSLSFNEVLQFAYESMQRRAVAIEQVTLDQALYRDLEGTDFLKEFRNIEEEIVGILCELHYAMIQQGVVPSESIKAEIMHEKYRDVPSTSGRRERDTIILREYISGLDYLMAVFGYFKNQAT